MLKEPLKDLHDCLARSSAYGSSFVLHVQTPSLSQPEYMATDNKSSLWTCTFCQSECGSFATAPVLEARLDITDEAGERFQYEHSSDCYMLVYGMRLGIL